jgi:hypothetical protein
MVSGKIKHNNPYVAGRALTEKHAFFGREDILQLVEAELLSTNQSAVVLFGQRRIGKTSILLKLQHRLSSLQFKPIYFDLMDRARQSLGQLLFELASTVTSNMGMVTPGKEYFDDEGLYFRREFLPSLYKVLGEEKRLVLLFDEFDVLDVAAEEQLLPTAATHAFFPYLRQLMQEESRLGFVFVVGRRAEELSIDVKATFKSARYKRVSVLDDESARELVNNAKQKGTLAFEESAIFRILALTAGHPYFTQLFCQILWNDAYAGDIQDIPNINNSAVDSAIPKVLEAGQNVFEWIWDGLPPAERVIFSAIAEATAEEPSVTEEALHIIFSRIYNCESTAVVGEPHIGKSSVLHYIANKKIQSDWLDEEDRRSIFIEIDCHILPESYQPADFWKYVLDQFEATSPEQKTQLQLEVVRRSNFGSFTLKSFFDQLSQMRLQIVLLIDEFDSLLHHPNFNTPEFFGALRSFSTSTDALTLVIASRLEISEMNRRSAEINPIGSPYFNTFNEVRLRPLHPDEVDKLIDQTLMGNAVIFSKDDRSYISRMVGRHPYLLQMAAAALFEAVVKRTAAEELYNEAGKILRDWSEAHFDDLWRYLSPEAQTVLVILVLSEMNGHINKRDFDTGDLGKLDWYNTELNRLADLGLVEKENGEAWHADWGNFVIWHGTRWRISAGCFIWWVVDNAIASTRKSLDFKKWLHDREFEGLLTRGEKEKLIELVGKIPKSVVTSASEFLGTVLKGLLK